MENLKLLVLKKKKEKKFKKIAQKYDKICVIGNNLYDDIISSYKIGSPYIYIGDSKIVKFILKVSNYIFDKNKDSAINKKGIQFKNFIQVKKIFEK